MIIKRAIYQAWHGNTPTAVARHEMTVELNEILPDVGDSVVIDSSLYEVTKRIFDYNEEAVYIKMKRE